MSNNVYQKVFSALQEADAVLMGASNGLSISEGFNLFADDRWFQENFGDFRAKYGIHSVLQGAFSSFPLRGKSGRSGAAWSIGSPLMSSPAG